MVNQFEVQGYSKQKAYEATGLDVELEMFKNATLAWKKAGAPMNTKALNAFMANYLKEKKARGAYLVVDAASDDTRLRPYEVINEVTTGKRKTTTFYQIKEAELQVKYAKATKTVVDKETSEEKEVEFLTPYRKETIKVEVVDKETGEKSTTEKEVEVPMVNVLSKGSVVAKAERKDTALKLMKELIETNKKNYVIEIVKEVTDGQPYAAYGVYTPSKSAKLGKFIFFTVE